MNYLSTEKIGPTRSKTPEGFLLCENVPIARTGLQIYGPGETPVHPGPDGIIRIERLPEEVFRPETIASFAGKPVVNDHPATDVTPYNWRDLAVGVTLNPRRGVGVEDDILVADLLITDAAAIDAILAGKREVSCGYDAEYVVMDAEQGRAKQTLIIGNHVALVDSGRCGPRCAIGDGTQTHDCCNEEKSMTIRERIHAAFKAKDEGKLEDALKELPSENTPIAGLAATSGTHVHVHVRDEDKKDDDDDDKDKDKTKDKVMDAMASDIKVIKDSMTSFDARLQKVEDAKKDDDDDDDDKTDDEAAFGMEAPPGTNDRAWAKDSAVFEESFQDTVAVAEIIAPGIRVPTFDAKAAPRKTFDALCSFRRKVLDTADRDPETHMFIDSITRGRTLDAVRCGDMRTLFNAVGQFKRHANNKSLTASAATTDRTSFGGGTGVRGEIKNNADLNKKMAEFYKR